MSEALVFAAKSGDDPAKVLEAIRAGRLAGSWALNNYAPKSSAAIFHPAFSSSAEKRTSNSSWKASREMNLSLPAPRSPTNCKKRCRHRGSTAKAITPSSKSSNNWQVSRSRRAQHPYRYLETIRTVRSVREFSPNPVPADVIQRILNAGRLSGTPKIPSRGSSFCSRPRRRLEALSKTGDYAGHLKGATFAIALLTEADKRAEYDDGRARKT